MKIIEYLLYCVILYVTYVIISSESSLIEHIKKDTIVNPLSKRDVLDVGGWKFVSAKGEECETSLFPLCDKLFIQDPEGSKHLIKEIASDSLDKKHDIDVNFAI